MFKPINIVFVCAFLFFFSACSNKNDQPTIKFSIDSTAVVLKNIDKVSLLKLRNLVNEDSSIDNFFRITEIAPATNVLITDKIVPGTVKMLGDSLLFVPVDGFKSGSNYLIESYVGVEFANIGQLLRNQGQINVQPQQKILVR